ncbi:bis(5'-nucleosyl)-tetraphosphatase (symmetrical) YqeK [Dethiobacter alkaliphilus]|uniref:bis(5'-nucleosyl)-tetraphosphatase (symmetrical) YqeK n=1 Tax=Dethiobacter alkaliphilus TaxID=427926 RepID=UPI0022279B3F|nr:bis(5'-nucleosyl)-tetraphosphatase (symmetrical) YqeK [Dethiobacter alkaliphilus]MCW3489240.1 bis(5'-nucleosyl)-tetraphosphatase (symmetrical) YqeK [Dethiobacter alkaliphilus]
MSKVTKGDDMSNKRVQQQIKESLSPELYQHSVGVAEMAVILAKQLGYDEKKAYLAGLLHDCARDWTERDLLRYSEKNGIEADKFSQKYPVLLHAAVGAAYVQEWGVDDNEILAAIRNHTLGYPGMSLLEQITYVADKIEQGRTYPGVEELRRTVHADFYQGLLAVAEQSISYILHKRQPLHPATISFWNWLVGQSKGE